MKLIHSILFSSLIIGMLNPISAVPDDSIDNHFDSYNMVKQPVNLFTLLDPKDIFFSAMWSRLFITACVSELRSVFSINCLHSFSASFNLFSCLRRSASSSNNCLFDFFASIFRFSFTLQSLYISAFYSHQHFFMEPKNVWKWALKDRLDWWCDIALKHTTMWFF